MTAKELRERQRLVEGIAAYDHEQKVVLRLLRKHEELSSKEFDRIFSDLKYVVGKDGVTRARFRRAKLRFLGAHPKSFILGGLLASGRLKWLQLVQIMAALGWLYVRRRGDEIYYSLT